MRSTLTCFAVISLAAGVLGLPACAAPVGDEPSESSNSAVVLNKCPLCGQQINYVAPPTSLTRTTNPQDCSAHTPAPGNLFAGWACAAAMQNGQIALVWNWADVGATSLDNDLGAPDGFHIYALRAGSPLQLWGVQTQGGTTTIAVPPDPLGGQICYRAAAYKGSVESSLSNTVCVTAPGTPTTTIHLQPQVMKTCSWIFDDNGNYFVTGPQTPPAGQFEVGYGALYTSTLLYGSLDSNWQAEGVFRYDTSAFQGHTIVSANIAFVDQGGSNCTNQVAMSAGDWIDNPNLCVNQFPPVGQDIATDFTPGQAANGLDATAAVRAWANQGAPNLGVLITPNDPASENEYCNANYSAPVLSVTYFP
jgi:hypothetical protein